MVNIPKDDNDRLDERYIQALMLARVVKRILKKRANIDLSSNPIFIVKPIAEFMNRIRVSSLSKFDETTYISTVNFYKSRDDLDKHDAVGVMIIYVGQSYLVELIKKLNYPDVDEDNQEVMLDSIGTLCNLIAGNFKTGLTQLGYIELVMSHFSGYENNVLMGIEFSPNETQMYEIQFEVDGKRRIVAEISMAPLPLNT
ncbi:MAG: chemotaxis protein CheX [Candidatus Omnitrophica bacterium]|nr:chemotaxis protein CheX [Candidatus Omnitrophota bacterium]